MDTEATPDNGKERPLDIQLQGAARPNQLPLDAPILLRATDRHRNVAQNQSAAGLAQMPNEQEGAGEILRSQVHVPGSQAQPDQRGGGNTQSKALSGARTGFLESTFVPSLWAKAIHENYVHDSVVAHASAAYSQPPWEVWFAWHPVRVCIVNDVITVSGRYKWRWLCCVARRPRPMSRRRWLSGRVGMYDYGPASNALTQPKLAWWGSIN